MKIGYNASSMQAYNALFRNDKSMVSSSAKLSSGVKINSASENAAGLAISNTLRTQAAGLEKSSLNASNAISLLQTADCTLNEMHSVIQRIRELSVQAANGTNNPDDAANLQVEIDELADEINKMSDRSEYNKIKLLKGDIDGDLSLTFHVGANQGNNAKIEIPEISASTLGLDSLDLVNDPTQAIVQSDAAIEKLSKVRAMVGAYNNRLERTSSYLDVSYAASSASLSRIYDTDMAFEMANYSRLQVLVQTATSIMAQANQTPQSVIQLIQ